VTIVSVGVIGDGSIGRPTATALADGLVGGCALAGTLTRRNTGSVPVDSLDELLDRSDLIVEAAGQDALVMYGPRIVEQGIDLLTVSVGALVDPVLRAALEAGPGRVEVSSGAVGGFDALRAAHQGGGLDAVCLTTTKPPTSVVEDWMPREMLDQLQAGEERVEVFAGPAAEAVERFPRSVNVAATLALATLGFDRTQVRVVADPQTSINEHLIEASGRAGSYAFRFRNEPSPDNPRTSQLTTLAVRRRLMELGGRLIVGV
jgi:aspartate dehydrogenase